MKSTPTSDAPRGDQRPRLMVVAGPNGSGKTSVTEQGLRHEWFSGCLYINPDNIAEELFGGWNSPGAILQAARRADEMREAALESRASIAFETVLSTGAKIDFLQRARDAGYFIRLFFVGTESPAINAARITQRFIKGGHEVPIEKIVSRFGRSMSNSIAAARLADRAYFYDNTPENQPASLVFRCKNGRVEKTYGAGALPAWVRPIWDALRK